MWLWKQLDKSGYQNAIFQDVWKLNGCTKSSLEHFLGRTDCSLATDLVCCLSHHFSRLYWCQHASGQGTARFLWFVKHITSNWIKNSFSHFLLKNMCFLLETFIQICRVIHKSLRDFRPLRYSSRDGHAKGKHVNRGRGTPSFCPTLQVLDMSTLGDVVDFNPVTKFLPHTCNVWQELDYRIDICRVTEGGHVEHL